jgi:hypothetical protein
VRDDCREAVIPHVFLGVSSLNSGRATSAARFFDRLLNPGRAGRGGNRAGLASWGKQRDKEPKPPALPKVQQPDCRNARKFIPAKALPADGGRAAPAGAGPINAFRTRRAFPREWDRIEIILLKPRTPARGCG